MHDYVENTFAGRQNPVSRYDYTTDDTGPRTGGPAPVTSREPSMPGGNGGLICPPIKKNLEALRERIIGYILA